MGLGGEKFWRRGGSIILEGSERGEGSKAEGPKIVEFSEGEESLAITEGAGKRQSSAAVDLEGLKKW